MVSRDDPTRPVGDDATEGGLGPYSESQWLSTTN
jgi:hypothetical protein